MQTTLQWLKKIRRFVPSWWFTNEKYAPAVFQAFSSELSGIQEDSDDHFKATFLLQATSPALDAHGAERNKTRLLGESDSIYALRIQRITSQTFRTAIEALVNSLLLVGPCEIFEAPFDSPFCSRSFFCSRGTLLTNVRINFFWIVVPKQLHNPYSFVSRSVFCSRLYFAGSLDVTEIVFNSIIKAVDEMKAFGVMYGVVEKAA